MLSSRLLPNGLFGGLLVERNKTEAELLDEMRGTWSLEQPASLADVIEWHRESSETYQARSQVTSQDGKLSDVLARAFVAWGPTPTEQQILWENRRAELLAVGLPVPRLFGEYPGMSIEEYVPDTLRPLNQLPTGECHQIGRIVAALHAIGYDLLHTDGNLRAKDGRVYLVDLGTDSITTFDLCSSTKPTQIRERFSQSGREGFDAGFAEQRD